MTHYEVEPPPALRSSISCFWYTRREFAALPASFEVVPDGYAELIFYFGGPGSLAVAAGAPPLPSPFMVGLLNQPVQFHTQRPLEIVGVRCLPWMVFALLGLPAQGEGVRVVEHPIARLQASLAERVAAGKLDEAFDQLAAYFLASCPPPGTGLLHKAGAALRAAHGTLPVSQVAAAAHATVRTLERQFKQAAGHTVKDVSSLMRFEQVRNRLWRQPAASLAALAQELGYTDQAHLSREFRRYAGTTPAAFARQSRREQAAVAPDFVAFVQA